MVVNDEIFGVDYDSRGGLTSTGDIALISNIDNAKQNIRNWLLTSKGYYPNIDDEYGSEIKEILGDDLTDDTIDLLKVYITNALYDNPRVENINAIETHITVKNELIVNLELELVDGSNTNVSFTLYDNNDENELLEDVD